MKKRYKHTKTRIKRKVLFGQLDKEFSLKVRMKSVDGAGFTHCFTCGLLAHYKKLQCGHYLSRFYKATRWDFDNARPQCMMCNLWKRGDPINFRMKLVAEIGVERVEVVESKRFAPFSEPDEWFQKKLEALKQETVQ